MIFQVYSLIYTNAKQGLAVSNDATHWYMTEKKEKHIHELAIS